ncbi:hypothetical protein MMC30_007307 [Trapelia coarctata]|nr:hypothetical protein [Trapelia coarctata]
MSAFHLGEDKDGTWLSKRHHLTTYGTRIDTNYLAIETARPSRQEALSNRNFASRLSEVLPGYEHVVPSVIPNKQDHSFVSARPAKLKLRRRRLINSGSTKIWLIPTKAIPGRFSKRWQLTKKIGLRWRPLIRRLKPTFTRDDSYSPQRLQSVLAQYLRRVHIFKDHNDLFSDKTSESRQEMDRSLLHVFNKDAISLMRSKGYDAGDVASWAAILTAESSEKAALLLTALSDGSDPDPQTVQTCIPTFVFMFLLRRQHITAQALSFLVIHAWNRLENRRNPEWVSALRPQMAPEPGVLVQLGEELRRANDLTGQYPPTSESTIVVMVIRLLRHARKLWPASLPAISALLTTHVTGGNQDKPKSSEMDAKTSSRLSFLYNRILHLLALPSSQHPYRDVPFHQRAQFDIIKRMNEFEPALTINREGYRAVARIQLAHRKTLEERAWAAMKAKSWPPWKEDKLGIDADIGIESGVSRANQVLIRSIEAGYAPRDWEVSAKILSGWDTDRSPTIQTRAIFRGYATGRRCRHPRSSVKNTTPSIGTWSARIQSTRTVEEAWACFLNYKDSKARPSLDVYHRMLEKIAFSQTRPCEGSQAGDGKEVAAPPTDPRDRIYVRTAPPSMNTFFDYMIADGIHPSGPCLNFLLNQAETLSDGLKYLESSHLPRETIGILLHKRRADTEYATWRLKSLPPSLLAAFIHFLCRFAASKGKFGEVHVHPLLHAFRLVYACKPAYRPPWYFLLSAVMRSRVGVTEHSLEIQSYVRDIAAWNSMLAILDQMGEFKFGLDFEGFYVLCLGLERAVASSQHILQELRRPLGNTKEGIFSLSWSDELANWERRQFDAEATIKDGPAMLKALFRRFVTGYFSDGLSKGYRAKVLKDGLEAKVLLPRLVVVPAPAELHAFIRVLGVSMDYEGILELVKWMVQFAMELNAVAAELKNGAVVMRRCLTAIRVFLEGHEQPVASAEDDPMDQNCVVDRAPDSIIEQIFTEIEGVEDWGGWPSDKEVEEYCSKDANTRGR